MELGMTARLLTERFGLGPDPIVARAPGRVNLIGEHTDYNNGYVLPFAIDRVIDVGIRPRKDQIIRIYADAFQDEIHLELPLSKISPNSDWGGYIKGVLIELSRYGELPFGFDGVIAGDVPQGAGLSSSASLEIAIAIGLSRVYGIKLGDLELIKLCQHMENTFVGTKCGIMDQYVAYFGKPGMAVLLDAHSLTHRYVPLRLTDVSLLVVDSGVNRALGTSGYNDRRAECEQALRLIQTAFPDRKITSLSDLTTDDLDDLPSVLPSSLFARVRHVVEENARVLGAVKALETDDYRTLGDLLFASHDSLRDLFQVSTPELNFLVDWGRKREALGARLVGGGFGGVTLHLVPDEIKADYIAGIVTAYRARFNRTATVTEVCPGPGAKELNSFME